jgi:Phosphotransferase enzyme family
MTENMGNQMAALREAAPTQVEVNLLPSSISKDRVLEILTSPEIMADFFRIRLPEILPEGLNLKECRPQVLKSRQDSRQVISYRLTFSSQSGRQAMPMMLVVKRFADAKKGMKEYLTMRMLWEKGFDHQSMLRIPRPFCYLEDSRLLVQESAHGVLLRKSLSRSSPVALARMKSAARWLVKLHHLDTDCERVGPHPDDETSIMNPVHRAESKEAWLSPRLEKLASLTLMKLSFFKNPPITLVHGDFQCENIFVGKEKVTVIDFGKFCKSDPARDLGYMIAQARTMGLLDGKSSISLSPGLKAFWEEYQTSVSAEEREALSARTCVFGALKYLENITYMAAYFKPGEKREIFFFLLDDTERFAKAGSVEEVLL